jgi:plasmid stabilization system protein ParE
LLPACGMLRSKPYGFHPAAWSEVEAADGWYAERSADASVGFLTAISDALEMIAASSDRWPSYLHGTRRFVLQRFPFSVIYLEDPHGVYIVAVAHGKRKPDYWKKRMANARP